MNPESNREVATALQAADEGTGGADGAGGSPDGSAVQGLPRIPRGQSGPGGFCGAGGSNSQSGPGTPNDHNGPVGSHCQDGLDTSNGQRGPGADNQGGPGILGGPGVKEMVGSAAGEAPNVARAGHASGPAVDAAPVAVGPGNRQIVFTLTVPFYSPLEAEMASLAMYADALHHWQGVQKEITVNGSIMAVCSAEDPGVLRVSFKSFLDRLSLVIRNIQRIRPLLPPSLGRKKRAGT